MNFYSQSNGVPFSIPSQSNFVSFHGQDGKETGRLTFTDGVMHFEGNADASTKIFLDELVHLFNEPCIKYATLSARIRDLLHLLEYAQISCPSPGDLEQAEKLIAHIKTSLG